MALVLILRYPLSTALTVAASLAQIGEFSFILAGLGVSLGLLDREAQSLILAGALISIAVNPFVFAVNEPLRAWVIARSALARRLEHRPDPFAELPIETDHKYLKGQVVLVGYGRVGRRIAQALSEKRIPFIVAEQNREQVEAMRKKGFAAVCGDAAADPGTLIQAHIAHAAMLVIATPDSVDVRKMADIARTLNPAIEIVVRTHSESELELLESDGIGRVFLGEEELARGMCQHILRCFAPEEQGTAAQTADKVLTH